MRGDCPARGERTRQVIIFFFKVRQSETPTELGLRCVHLPLAFWNVTLNYTEENTTAVKHQGEMGAGGKAEGEREIGLKEETKSLGRGYQSKTFQQRNCWN